MKSLTMMVAVAAASTMLATSAYAQAAATPNPQKPAPTPTAPAPPATQQKPATPPAPQPPRPFPEGSKFAFVDIQVIASNSAEGKAATAKREVRKPPAASRSTKQQAAPRKQKRA